MRTLEQIAKEYYHKGFLEFKYLLGINGFRYDVGYVKFKNYENKIFVQELSVYEGKVNFSEPIEVIR